MGRQSTAEDEDDEFQMQEENQQCPVRNAAPGAKNSKVSPESLRATTLCCGWIQRGCTLSCPISLSNQGAEMQKAKGMLPLMGFGSSSDKWFKKKL